jgi:hypothetical protein
MGHEIESRQGICMFLQNKVEKVIFSANPKCQISNAVCALTTKACLQKFSVVQRFSGLGMYIGIVRSFRKLEMILILPRDGSACCSTPV